MDDKAKSDVNQSQPVFETVPEENENLVPEEVAPEVALPTGEEVGIKGPQIPEDIPPPVYDDRRSKFIFLGITVAIFVFLLFLFMRIFMGASKGPAAPVKLVYWGLWEDKEIMQPIIDDYHRKHPQVTVDYQKLSPLEYREKLLARKTGGPDIFRFHNTWLPEIKDVVSAVPADVMSVAEFEKTFYKIHQTDLKIGNYYYGLPLTIDGLVLIVNDGLLKKAGVNKIPTTWDEVADAVVKLTVKEKGGAIVTSGIALGTVANVEHFSDIFGLMLVQNGGDLKKLTTPEASGALESYRKFAEPPNNFWDETRPNSMTAFIQEKVGMIIAPSWEIMVIKTVNPDIKIKVVTIPTVPGAKPVSLASYWVEGVSRYSPNQIEAWKFGRYLTEKESMTKLYENEAKVRLFGEPYSRVDLAPLLVQNEYIGAVIKQADAYVSLPIISRTFDNGLNDAVVKYIENAINASSQGVSYNEALATAAKGINQVFSQYKIE